MSNPINSSIGAPVPRPTSTEPRPKTSSATESTFSVPTDTGDTVPARTNLSFGSLAPLVKTDLSNDSAIVTAQQIEKLLQKEPLPVVNNRPQVINNLYEALLKEQGG